MRNIIYIFLFCLIFQYSQALSQSSNPKRIIENNAFKVGEKLTLSISYEFIPAGKTEMYVRDIRNMNGRKAYYITTRTQSHRLFDPFFKVRDEIDTWVDVETFASLKFKKKLREGSYHYDYAIEFDQESHTAFSKGPNGNRNVDIEPFTRDILSGLYYLRTLDLNVGDVATVITLDNDKLYPLDLVVRGRERISVKAGKFDCLIVEPMLQGGGLFKYEGKVRVWITDDHRKIPVLIKAKAIIGSVIIELEKVEGLVD